MLKLGAAECLLSPACPVGLPCGFTLWVCPDTIGEKRRDLPGYKKTFEVCSVARSRANLKAFATGQNKTLQGSHPIAPRKRLKVFPSPFQQYRSARPVDSQKTFLPLQVIYVPSESCRRLAFSQRH